MAELQRTMVRIGPYTVATDVGTAEKIARDPDLLLRVYDMMVEAACKIDPTHRPPE